MWSTEFSLGYASSNPDTPGVKEMLFTSLGEICSLFTRILNFRLSLGVSLVRIPPVVYYY